MNTTLASQEEIQKAAEHLSTGLPNNRFSAKVIASSHAASKCEEFNIWHAASDNVTNNGTDLAWGGLATPKIKATTVS